MHTPFALLRGLAAAALLATCGTSAALAQATNLPPAHLRAIMVNTNGVVKAPAYLVSWPTQTNTFHRATVTNLFAVTAGVTGNQTIGGTLGVSGASTLASAGITGNATIGGTLNVTGTITGPGSGITGVLAANVPIVDAGGLLDATNAETALAELATELAAVDVGAYLSIATAATTYLKLDTSNDPLTASLRVEPTAEVPATLTLKPVTGAYDAYGFLELWGNAFLQGYGKIEFKNTADSAVKSDIQSRTSGFFLNHGAGSIKLETDGTVTFGGLEYPIADGDEDNYIKTDGAGHLSFGILHPVASTGSASDLGSGTLDNARLDVELSSIAGLTSAADRFPYFTGSGTADLAVLTAAARSFLSASSAADERTTLGLAPIASSGSASDLSGDLPAAGFGEVAIQWSAREFIKEEGTTNSVGWVEYTNTAGSRRFTVDAISTAITTDQAATLRSSVKRVPYGFAAFKTAGALRITWVSNDSGGDCEIRGITLTGWSDITSTETVLHTYSGALDVSAAGTPTVVSIDAASFTGGTTVPQWIAVDVVFSVEDGDKTGILLVEVLSQ